MFIFQFFNQINKKVLFETRTYIEPINKVKIGVYTIENDTYAVSLPLVVIHLEERNDRLI